MAGSEMIEIRVGGRREEESVTAAAAKEEQNRINRREFKQFGIIPTAADNNHYYYAAPSTSSSNHQKLSKKIMKEWKILEQNLPDSIFVRVYESRIDLIRAVIIGAAGTPYHDGLFFFDIQFPSDYPNQPPKVYYHSFGHRLNPNLYASGVVCLSLLNTWVGGKDEQWNPSESTVLQILLSIQALVLNSKPFFNEPLFGYIGHWNTISLAYNQDVFVLSCKTMLALLNRPPKHFEEFVRQHFRDRAETFLVACKAYIEGRVRVGGAVTATTTTAVVAANAKTKFQKSMMFINTKLVKAFIENGSSSLENYVGHDMDENENEPHKTIRVDQAIACCLCLLILVVICGALWGLWSLGRSYRNI